jgi:ribonuclease BN (tRNA processing enzyme)
MRRTKRIAILVLLGLWAHTARASAQTCQANGVALQILGSNGPRIRSDRAAASASYLIWIDGRSRILVDAGGGAFLRFAEAGGQFEDLTLIAISHLHPDHVSDLPALLWGNFVRKTPLPIAGPSGNADVPDFRAFLERLFDQQTGAFRMLGATLGGASRASLGGAGRLTRLEIVVVDVASDKPSSVLERDGLIVTAFRVPHGDIPTLAYRIRVGDRAIVFGTDQTGTDPRFAEFARGADLLVLHMTVGVGAKNPLHAAPDRVGQVARDAKPAQLILSHLDPNNLEAAVAEVKKNYSGPVTVASDLQCTPVP